MSTDFSNNPNGGWIEAGGYLFLSSPTDSYGILPSELLIGGHQEFITIDDRNNIPVDTSSSGVIGPDGISSGRRKLGMTVRVIDPNGDGSVESKIYCLIPKGYFGNEGSSSISDWNALSDQEKIVLLNPSASVTYTDESFNQVTVNGTGNPDDCWVELNYTGDIGPQGAQGAQGAASTVAGPQGAQGAQGAASTVAGPQGAPGVDSTIAGPQGAQGAPGVDSTVAGPQGAQGDTGAQGAPGNDATGSSFIEPENYTQVSDEHYSYVALTGFYIHSTTGSNPIDNGEIALNGTTFGDVTQIKISNKNVSGTSINNYLSNINYGSTITVVDDGGVNPNYQGVYLATGNSTFNFISINEVWYEIDVVFISGDETEPISTSTVSQASDNLLIHTPTLFTVSDTYQKLEISPNYDAVQDDFDMELTLVPDSSFDIGQIFLIEYKVNPALYDTLEGRRLIIKSMNSYYPSNPESTTYTIIEDGTSGIGQGFITLMLNKIEDRFGLSVLGVAQV